MSPGRRHHAADQITPSLYYEDKLAQRQYDPQSKEQRAKQREAEASLRLAQRQTAGKADSTAALAELLDPRVGGLASLPATSNASTSRPVSTRRLLGQSSHFLVDLIRLPGQDLGIVFDDTFQVIDLGTEETSIGNWNLEVSKTYPDAAVQLGDVIVSVNDMRDIYDMRSQIAEEDITSFELLVRSEG